MLDIPSPVDASGPVVPALRELLASGRLDLPLPGAGATARRWAGLAALGRTDLALGRLAEGHCDAVAILAEAGLTPAPGALYGVWAARSGGTGAVLDAGVLSGTVRFCSGAHALDRSLVVALDEDRRAVVVDVDVSDPRVVAVDGTWQALGMAASDSCDVELHDLPADRVVGAPGWYLSRPGFWLGGAGVAAVWLGGAVGVLDSVYAALAEADPHQAAHLGALHTAVAAARAVLADAAAKADDGTFGALDAWTCRSAAEKAAWDVLDRVPRITGPTPLCRDGRFARRLADLQVYVRQHHAEKDLAALGQAALAEARRPSAPPFDLTGYGTVVAVAAHPDDETLGAGGTLQLLHAAGATVRLVVATDGEGAFPEADAEERAALAATRRGELADALKAQGLDGTEVHWLGLPDSELPEHRDELVGALRPLLADADCVLLPWPGDPHCDHETAGEAALAAAPAGAHRWSYPIWMWERTARTDPAVPWPHARTVRLGTAEREKKQAAIDAFASQLVKGPRGEDPILPPAVLAHFTGQDEVLFREPNPGSATGRFAELYEADPDPWQTRDSAYEKRKRELAVAALPRERYRRAVEPACGTGELTRLLVEKCDEVDAFDPVPAAIEAAERQGLPVRVAALPDGLGSQKADLIVFSEILYYLSDADLAATLDRAVEVLEPGGDLLLVHWRPWAPEAPRDAAAAHERAAGRPELTTLLSAVDQDFLVTVLRKR